LAKAPAIGIAGAFARETKIQRYWTDDQPPDFREENPLEAGALVKASVNGLLEGILGKIGIRPAR
jgi:hypothetical protein